MNYTDNEKAIIILDSLYGLEYKFKTDVLKAIDNPQKLLEFDLKTLKIVTQVVGESKAQTIKLAFEKAYAESVIDEIEKRELTAITYVSKNYPEELKETPNYPLVLYAKGNLNLLKNPNKFGIVGSRKTLPYATAFATKLAENLASRGAVIVTGSASGGDRSAIQGALESGNIISVLAHGHDMIYPESNRDLIDKICKKGLVITEYPYSVSARSWMFPIRNRIIAGLSKGVLIISGEADSGARHTANFALEYNREVFAIPYSLGISSGELCNELIKSGANLLTCAEDVEQCLKLESLSKKDKIALDSDESAVYNAIREGADDANKLLKVCNLKIFQLAPIISSLELKGLIVKLLGNRFKTVE